MGGLAVVGVAAIMAGLVVVGMIREGAAYVDVKHIRKKPASFLRVFESSDSQSF